MKKLIQSLLFGYRENPKAKPYLADCRANLSCQGGTSKEITTALNKLSNNFKKAYNERLYGKNKRLRPTN